MSEARRLGRNFGSIAVSQFYAQILAFVISVVTARTLGVENYGLFVFGFAFPSWFLIVIYLGLDSVLTIDIAADEDRASQYLSIVALIRLFSATGVALAFWLSVNSLSLDLSAKTAIFLFGLSGVVSAYGSTFSSVIRAFERLEYRALILVIERTITTAIVLFLLFSGYGLLELSLTYLFASFLSLGLTLIVVRWKFTWFTGDIQLRSAFKLLKRALPFAAGGVVSTFAATSAPVLLTLLRGATETGVFNAAHALLLALLAPVSLYNTVFLPAMSRIYTKSSEDLPILIEKTRRFGFLFGFPAALGGWFYADELVGLVYGSEFAVSARTLEVLVWIIALTAANLGTGTALAATDRQTINLAVASIGTAVNFILCIIWIPALGHMGAAYAGLTSNLVSAALGLGIIHRLVAPVDWNASYSRPLAAGTLMIGVLFILPSLPLWIGILSGVGLYFAALVTLGGIKHDDWAIIKEAFGGALFR